MEICDTHCHVYMEEFDNDRDEVLARAGEAGVKKFLLPNVDASTVERMSALVAAHPGMCFPMMGIHPTSVNGNFADELKVFDREMEKNVYVAVGEIGLDLYWDKTFLREQKKVFEYQVGVAVEKGLPVSIHNREAFAEVVDSLKKFDKNKLRGVFHCFTLPADNASTIFSLGDFYLGIGGPATYKNAKFVNRLQEVPLQRIVVETDCPYLPPVPHRGERNEPSYLVHVLAKLSEIYGLAVDQVADTVYANSETLFFN